MRISAKGEYAIRALLDLAVHHGEGLVPIQEVARRQSIPQRYLEQVLLLLKRAGILESKQLVRSPAGISVGDVLRAVEGRVTALDVAGRHPSKTSDAGASDLAPLWREIAGAVGEVIDRTTFGDLAEQVKARRSPERSIYHI
jgi:Rrf2 family transcriptional regulator, cysteine metabolism repressor